jgi:hypothetical protein
MLLLGKHTRVTKGAPRCAVPLIEEFVVSANWQRILTNQYVFGQTSPPSSAACAPLGLALPATARSSGTRAL